MGVARIGWNTKNYHVNLDFKLSRVLNAVLCFFLGGGCNLPASVFLVPTFRNLVAVPSS